MQVSNVNIGTQWFSNAFCTLPFPFRSPLPPPTCICRSLQVRGCTCSFADLSLRRSRSVSLRRIWPPYTSFPLLGPDSCLAGWLLLLNSRSTRAVSLISALPLRGRFFSLLFDPRLTRMNKGRRKIASRFLRFTICCDPDVGRRTLSLGLKAIAIKLKNMKYCIYVQRELINFEIMKNYNLEIYRMFCISRMQTIFLVKNEHLFLS